MLVVERGNQNFCIKNQDKTCWDLYKQSRTLKL